MAVGFILAKKACDWAEVHSPSFVFTSPNMNQGISAGTRSHIVPEEIPLALWLEDSSRDIMNRIMLDQSTIEYCSGAGGYDSTITIPYDNYAVNRYAISKDFDTSLDTIFVTHSVDIPKYSYIIYDTFSNNYIDTSKWSVTISANGSVSVSDGKLHISCTKVSTSEYTYCKTLGTCSGDFIIDVKISSNLTNAVSETNGPEIKIPYTGSSYIYVKLCKSQLIVGITGGSSYNYTKLSDYMLVKIKRISDTIHVYIAQLNDALRLYRSFSGADTSDIDITLGLSVDNTTGIIDGYFDYLVATDSLNVFLPEMSNYDNRFYCISSSPEVTNWFKLNDSPPDYSDSVGGIQLTSSGVTRDMNLSVGDYVAYFDVNSIMYSTTAFNPTGEFSVSLFVDNYGLTCGSESEFFGECQTFVNLYAFDGSYFSVGTTDTNTLYYKVHTSVSTFYSDTGITMVSGTFENIALTCSSGTGIKFYYNGDKVSEINSVIGTVSSGIMCFGNVNRGVGSKFKGHISDVKLVSSGILTANDNKTISDAGPINQLYCSLYGFSVGDISLSTGDYVYYDFPDFKSDLYLTSSLHILIRFGEAYNCYITAWDDTSHTTTSNSIFTNNVIKLSAAVYRANHDTSNYPLEDVSDVGSTYMVYHAVSDMPVKGDDYYFGKFNAVYFIGDSNYAGDIISFRPRISEVTKAIFPPGNYDFVITFHYQYT